MLSVAVFLVDFQSAADVAHKRQMLQGWTDTVLRAALARNRIELAQEVDGLRIRRILSGSILIRCELTRRRTGAALGEPAPSPQTDTPMPRFV